MVSGTELEIAMNIVQLTGVTIPVLLGVVQYYLKDEAAVEDVLKSHGEIVEDATFLDFFMPLAFVLLLAYATSALLIAANAHILIAMSLTLYGFFLWLLIAVVRVRFDESPFGFVKPIWDLSVGAMTIMLFVIAGIVFFSGNLVAGFIFIALLVFLRVGNYVLYKYYRWAKAREDENTLNFDAREEGEIDTETNGNNTEMESESTDQ